MLSQYRGIQLDPLPYLSIVHSIVSYVTQSEIMRLIYLQSY